MKAADINRLAEIAARIATLTDECDCNSFKMHLNVRDNGKSDDITIYPSNGVISEFTFDAWVNAPADMKFMHDLIAELSGQRVMPWDNEEVDEENYLGAATLAKLKAGEMDLE